MKQFNGLYEQYLGDKQGIVAIGTFDSLHVGHMSLLAKLAALAKEFSLVSYILTFKTPPPKEVQSKSILEYQDKIMLLEQLGIDFLICCDFDENFQSLSPELFAKTLEMQYHITHYCEGVDFRFGCHRSGDLSLLRELGYSVFLQETFKFDDKKVSTSEIKKYIRCGEMGTVNKLLGRSHFIHGTVKQGKQLGRTFGFPTMNITNEAVIYPSSGSYITKTSVENKSYPSMTFVDESIIESHLLGFCRYDYGFPIKIEFLEKIRDNRKFSGIEELKEQLQKDFDATKKYFRDNYKDNEEI